MDEPKPKEEEVPTRETLGDEAIESYNSGEVGTHQENQRVTFGNLKKTYDLHQEIDAGLARTLNSAIGLATQHAVTTANLIQTNAAAVTNLVNNNTAFMSAVAQSQMMQLTNLAHDSFWNPVASGAGMNLTAGAVPANRATDVAAAGVGTASEGVAASVSKMSEATVPVIVAVLTNLNSALATMQTQLASVLAQVQPKTT